MLLKNPQNFQFNFQGMILDDHGNRQWRVESRVQCVGPDDSLVIDFNSSLNLSF